MRSFLCNFKKISFAYRIKQLYFYTEKQRFHSFETAVFHFFAPAVGSILIIEIFYIYWGITFFYLVMAKLLKKCGITYLQTLLLNNFEYICGYTNVRAHLNTKNA